MTRRKKLKTPSEVLEIYNQELAKGLEQKLSPAAFELKFSFRSPKVAALSGFVIFPNGYLLEFDEIIQQERNQVSRAKYRYQVMDNKKNLVFRYDNVAHHPETTTHPHHKHLPGKIVNSSAPNLIEVIEEVELFIIKQ